MHLSAKTGPNVAENRHAKKAITTKRTKNTKKPFVCFVYLVVKISVPPIHEPGGSWDRPLPARMMFGVKLLQSFLRDVGVDLRGGDIRMPQQ